MSHRQKRRCMAAVAVAYLLFTTSCEREIRVRVAKPMNWECAPEHYMPAYPEAQPVRFRFVEDTHYEEVVSGRGLCDQLKNGGKPVVTVEFELWGDKVHGLRGWNEISVEGKPIVNVGGWGSAGGHGFGGPHPLDLAFKKGGTGT